MQRSIRALAIQAGSVALISGVAVLDYMTGLWLNMALLYLLPVAAVAWYVSPRAAWFPAAVATVAYVLAEDVFGHYLPEGAAALNALLRFLVIALVISLIGRLRDELARRQQAIDDLGRALAEVKALSGLIPVCAWCRKLRDDQGYWSELEAYLASHTGAEVTHGMCEACAATLEAGVDREDAATGSDAAPGAKS